jgi:RES domain-containing protein
MALSETVTPFYSLTHRLIASRWPTVGAFDDLVDPADAEAAMELEGATNDRLTGALGRLAAIPAGDRAMGPGATIAMAAFLHPSPGGGRFSHERLGAWYAACEPETAIQETLFHHGRRLRASESGFPNRMEMREVLSNPRASLRDLRGLRARCPELYDPEPSQYHTSQKFGEDLRRSGADGIIYESVRHTVGTNIVLFKPRLVMPVRQGEHYVYTWDASGTASVAKLTNMAND